jgi:hypothetical protein
VAAGASIVKCTVTVLCRSKFFPRVAKMASKESMNSEQGKAGGGDDTSPEGGVRESVPSSIRFGFFDSGFSFKRRRTKGVMPW